MNTMTFGEVKSIIENNLIESYKEGKDFKKLLKEFKHNVLNDNNMSKIYSLYNQLSSSQGLNADDAKCFLEEGITLIQSLIPSIKTSKSMTENTKNEYSDIDTLVYLNKLNLSERVQSKKNIIKTLMSDVNIVKESINIPIKSMISIANKTMSNYISSLDENTRKEFLQIISEDSSSLEVKFESIRENAISKLTTALGVEAEDEMKITLSETIDKIKNEKFSQLNFLRLRDLEESI